MIKLISFLTMVAILAFAPNTGQDKEYKISLTLSELNTIIANPDDVSVNGRKAVIQKIIMQVQPQIAADTIPKKK